MCIAICSLWSTDHTSKVSQADTPRGGNCIDENQRWPPAHMRKSNGTHTFISHQCFFDGKTYVCGVN